MWSFPGETKQWNDPKWDDLLRRTCMQNDIWKCVGMKHNLYYANISLKWNASVDCKPVNIAAPIAKKLRTNTYQYSFICKYIYIYICLSIPNMGKWNTYDIPKLKMYSCSIHSVIGVLKIWQCFKIRVGDSVEFFWAIHSPKLTISVPDPKKERIIWSGKNG